MNVAFQNMLLIHSPDDFPLSPNYLMVHMNHKHMMIARMREAHGIQASVSLNGMAAFHHALDNCLASHLEIRGSPHEK